MALRMLLLLALVPLAVHGHGFLAVPACRGNLDKNKHFNPNTPVIMPGAKTDDKIHFPMGDKTSSPGAAKRSQEIAAGSAGWTEFKPYDRNFRWRGGICGDELGKPQDHMKGGKYYNGGVRVATWFPGQHVKMAMNVIAHHGGFVEAHICDVTKCGGEMAKKCYWDGHCKQMMVTRTRLCESRTSMRCAPVDPKYPGRWFLPCSAHYHKSNDMDYYGWDKYKKQLDGTMMFTVPKDFPPTDHAVLHFYWVGTNSCNPPGFKEYFDSNRSPKWGNCVGQGGAVGGVSRQQPSCGNAGGRFAEEYLQCADIRIGTPGIGSRAGTEPVQVPNTPPPPPTTTTTTAAPVTQQASAAQATYTQSSAGADGKWIRNDRSGVLRDLVLVADGKKIRSVYDGNVLDMNGYEKWALEAVTDRQVRKVKFYVGETLVWTEEHSPYFMYGNRGSSPMYWRNPPLNVRVKVKIVVEWDSGTFVDVVNIIFKKQR